MKNFPKILYASTLLLWLGGCSVADMAYNNAPRFVAGELEEAFDLSETQSSQLDSRLDQFFIWHRQEELGRYREILERAALAAADGITASEFLILRNDIGAAWNRSIEKSIDSLGDLFARKVSATTRDLPRRTQFRKPRRLVRRIRLSRAGKNYATPAAGA